jgi:hypothetical protein
MAIAPNMTGITSIKQELKRAHDEANGLLDDDITT